MDAVMEKECSALGGLFQSIMNDMKASYPAWEDFVTKGAKLQSQLRTTIIVIGSFLDAFQKVADIATGTRGATKEIGSALTRMCMRHRSIESKLKLFTTSFMDKLISPLELTLEDWKKVASQLDKDHAKEYKKARADIRKKSSDTIKLQKKVKKGKDEVRMQLDSALQDVNTRYTELEETEKKAVCRALVEERGRFCSFVTMLKPVLEQSLKIPGTEHGTTKLQHQVYSGYGERARAQSTSGKPKTAREQLALTLAGTLNSETSHTSRDSLHCSSGYSTQTTTPSCSEDTIPSQHDYDYISLHGGDDIPTPSDFDKSCTIPRNSELSLNYRKLFQSKRPASTVSLLTEPESLLLHQPHTATIRRKPSSKANLRRGTISGGVPIPISTPQVPLKPSTSLAGLAPGRSGSEEAVCPQVPTQTAQQPSSDLAHAKHALCTSTQNMGTMPTPYYAMFPGQPPVGITEQIYQTSKQHQGQVQHHNDNQQYNQKQQYYQEYNKQEQPIQYQQQYHQAQQEPQYRQQYIEARHHHPHYKQQYQQQTQHIPAQHPKFPKQHPIQQHDQQKQQQSQLPQQNAALQCWSSAPAPDTANHSDNTNDSSQVSSGGGDMLSMIRRGVKLRRTLTNDRSAPLITTNYLN
ncbi:protein MTSS 1 isoform X2 [Neoarius graeffei]|uniref:protein MTSS 1 isoform X2 n=1 Tax=Neoarius graeffei TaxID=443677 RepID=UPI00298D21FF|nr:protein MTSS 1 isoform X2 [Neoarius graeffei]